MDDMADWSGAGDTCPASPEPGTLPARSECTPPGQSHNISIYATYQLGVSVPLDLGLREAHGESVKVDDDRFLSDHHQSSKDSFQNLSDPQEPLDSMDCLVQRVLFYKVVNQPELLRCVRVVTYLEVVCQGSTN